MEVSSSMISEALALLVKLLVAGIGLFGTLLGLILRYTYKSARHTGQIDQRLAQGEAKFIEHGAKLEEHDGTLKNHGERIVRVEERVGINK